MDKKKFYLLSISWGKDSVAMLLLLIFLKKQIDLVLFVNTGREFKAVYDVRDKVLNLLLKCNIPYVELDVSAEYGRLMYEHEIAARDGSSDKIGYGWCGGVCRWGTALKLGTINKYIRRELAEYDVFEYVGIAADEPDRISDNHKKLYPLYDYGITENMALDICYLNGLLYEENGIYLYEHMSNLSCWCCRNKNLRELKAMYYLLPYYFDGLKEIQKKFPHMPMKGEGADVFALEKRFLREGMRCSLFDLFPYPLMKEAEGRSLPRKEGVVIIDRQIS